VAAIISLGAGAALSHVIEPGIRVEKIILATNTPAKFSPGLGDHIFVPPGCGKNLQALDNAARR
jgi:hypothetical protein